MRKETYLTENQYPVSQLLMFFIALISFFLIIRGFYLIIFNFETVSYFFILTAVFSVIVIIYLGSSLTKKYNFKHRHFYFNLVRFCFNDGNLAPTYILLILLLGFPFLYFRDFIFSDIVLTSRVEVLFIIINLLCFSLLLFLYGLLNRIYVKNIFPFFELSTIQNHLLILIVNYDDFINKKIDNPCLNIGQDFLIKIHEHPRNEDEKNTVLLINQNTTPKPTIVTVIINKELADGLRNDEFILKTELKSISEFTKLEIALWLDRNYQS
jgi:hypothetical protein